MPKSLKKKQPVNYVQAVEFSESDSEEKDQVVLTDTVGWIQEEVKANSSAKDHVRKKKKTLKHEHPNNKISSSHQLFIQFRGGKGLEPSEIKELHPDIQFVKVFRKRSCGKCIMTFASEKHLKNALPVLKNMKVNDRKLIVCHKEEERSNLPFLPHTAPRLT